MQSGLGSHRCARVGARGAAAAHRRNSASVGAAGHCSCVEGACPLSSTSRTILLKNASEPLVMAETHAGLHPHTRMRSNTSTGEPPEWDSFVIGLHQQNGGMLVWRLERRGRPRRPQSAGASLQEPLAHCPEQLWLTQFNGSARHSVIFLGMPWQS